MDCHICPKLVHLPRCSIVAGVPQSPKSKQIVVARSFGADTAPMSPCLGLMRDCSEEQAWIGAVLWAEDASPAKGHSLSSQQESLENLALRWVSSASPGRKTSPIAPAWVLSVCMENEAAPGQEKGWHLPHQPIHRMPSLISWLFYLFSERNCAAAPLTARPLSDSSHTGPGSAQSGGACKLSLAGRAPLPPSTLPWPDYDLDMKFPQSLEST